MSYPFLSNLSALQRNLNISTPCNVFSSVRPQLYKTSQPKQSLQI